MCEKIDPNVELELTNRTKTNAQWRTLNIEVRTYYHDQVFNLSGAQAGFISDGKKACLGWGTTPASPISAVAPRLFVIEKLTALTSAPKLRRCQSCFLAAASRPRGRIRLKWKKKGGIRLSSAGCTKRLMEIGLRWISNTSAIRKNQSR